ncbi:hypothetical protein D3C80_2019080 [compost metagenome]
MIEPKRTNTPPIPRMKPKSPTRLTMNAFMAAAEADGFLNQKPMSRYEARPTPSQPKNICSRLSEVISINIAKVNSER